MIFLTQALAAQGVAASDGAAVSVEDAAPSSAEGSRQGRAFGEGDIDFASWGAASPETGLPASGGRSAFGLGLYVRMVVVLAVILAAIFLVFRFMRRASGGGGVPSDDSVFLRRISGVPLGANKSVQVVTLVDRAYVVGVADASVSLLGVVEDKELVNAMNLWSDKQNRTSKPRSFAEVLDMFMPGGGRSGAAKDSGLFSSSDREELLDSLKRQSKRLDESGGEGL